MIILLRSDGMNYSIDYILVLEEILAKAFSSAVLDAIIQRNAI
jgi:hypothetical protein